MSKKSRYIKYFLRNLPSTLLGRLLNKPKQIKRFNGEKGITTEKSGEYLSELIEKGEPFAAIRFGGTEISCLNNHEKIRLGFKKTYKDSVRWAMKVRGGYFPTDDDSLSKYAELFEGLSPNIDVLAISGLHMEDYFASSLCPNAKIISNWGMEPLLGGWSKALKGRKVLVISPFKKEIEKQYSIKEKLFSDPSLLPEFDLKIIEAPKTMGDNDSFELDSSLEYLGEMQRQIDKLDFDIALIGAGAYGSLLAMYCRKIGKMAIQSGGATQTLFGIIGKRWEDRGHVSKHINEHWIRPLEKPEGYEKIDNGAYW